MDDDERRLLTLVADWLEAGPAGGPLTVTMTLAPGQHTGPAFVASMSDRWVAFINLMATERGVRQRWRLITMHWTDDGAETVTLRLRWPDATDDGERDA